MDCAKGEEAMNNAVVPARFPASTTSDLRCPRIRWPRVGTLLLIFAVLAAAGPGRAAGQTISSITPSPALPVVFGTPITWTVTATGGTAPLQYRFFRYDAGVWNMVKDYSTSNTFSWTPAFADIGQHDLAVWVKSNGSPNQFDTTKDTGFFNINGLATVTALTANPTLPRAFGTAITWTATATGAAPLTYRFYRWDAGVWNMVRDYSTTNTYSWTPASTDIGQHDVVVWVKSNGSTAAFDATRETGFFNINGTASVSAITPSPVSPSPAGVPVVWTGTATGNPGPLQYQFWRLDGATWKMAQDYSLSKTYTWIPAVGDVGTHVVAVWVRNQGSAAAFEATRASGSFTITAAQPLAASALQYAPDLPRPDGAIILFKPATTGGLAPLTYRFYRYSYATAAWTIVQDFSTNDTFTWQPTPSEDGAYQIAVWIKNAGSTAQYDAVVSTPPVLITPQTADVIRFLEQATWGPTNVEVERARSMGYTAWIVDQFTQPMTGYPAFTPVPDNPASNCTGNCQRDNYSMYPLQKQFFLNALYGNDQLRQRVAWALHTLVVTSGLDLNLPSWSQPYHDILYTYAFGNYRQHPLRRLRSTRAWASTSTSTRAP